MRIYLINDITILMIGKTIMTSFTILKAYYNLFIIHFNLERKKKKSDFLFFFDPSLFPSLSFLFFF